MAKEERDTKLESSEECEIGLNYRILVHFHEVGANYMLPPRHGLGTPKQGVDITCTRNLLDFTGPELRRCYVVTGFITQYYDNNAKAQDFDNSSTNRNFCCNTIYRN